MNTRRTMLLVAILLALGTGWLTFNYLASLQRQSLAQGQPREVVVAVKDIPARATITVDMIQQQLRPQSATEPDAVTSLPQAVGSLALISIPSGSQLTTSRIGRPSELALPVRLQPGMRAVSIQIDKVKGVSGLVQPGDRVDVIAIPPRTGNELPHAAAILRGVRVLAIGTTLESPSSTPSPEEQNSTTVTLEVTPDQANLVSMADVNSTLRLALRSPKEAIRSLAPQSFSLGNVATYNAAPQSPVQATQSTYARPAQNAPRASSGSSVEVIVGDQIVQSKPR